MTDTPTVRSIESKDIPLVARMHAEELAGSFLAELGVGFLEMLYTFMRTDPTFIGLVAESGRELVGYVAASSDTDGFYRRIYLRNVVAFAGAVVGRARTKPLVAWRALQVLTSRTPETRPRGERAELLSIAVRSERRGTGAGRALVATLRAHLETRGKNTCSVIVERGIPAHRFYRSLGFVERAQFRLHGAPSSVYVLDLRPRP